MGASDRGGRRAKHQGGGPDLDRRHICAEAARIMAEEGVGDFHAAKRKAAERLNLPFLRMGIPMFDRLGAAHQVTLGYRGTRDLIFEVANMFMAEAHERGASASFVFGQRYEMNQGALTRERRAGREPDPRSWEAVRVARFYAEGLATQDELAAARYGARAASLKFLDSDRPAGAAWAVARVAVWTSTAVAADAAWVAADAAWVAADAAASRDAASSSDVECRWQCARLLRLLREEEP